MCTCVHLCYIHFSWKRTLLFGYHTCSRATAISIYFSFFLFGSIVLNIDSNSSSIFSWESSGLQLMTSVHKLCNISFDALYLHILKMHTCRETEGQQQKNSQAINIYVFQEKYYMFDHIFTMRE